MDSGCRFSFTFNEKKPPLQARGGLFYRLFFLKTVNPLRLKIAITAKLTISVQKMDSLLAVIAQEKCKDKYGKNLIFGKMIIGIESKIELTK